MHLIHPEHPSSELRIPRSGKPAIRPSGGLLSERRLVYFPSGAPTIRNQSLDNTPDGLKAGLISLSRDALFNPKTQ
jgi:hypothetical protein